LQLKIVQLGRWFLKFFNFKIDYINNKLSNFNLVENLKKFTKYDGFKEDEDIIKWFW